MRDTKPSTDLPLAEGELARVSQGHVRVRTTPLRVRFDLGQILTSDDHHLHVRFVCSVLPLDEPAEREMLREAFLTSHGVARVDAVATHFEPTLRNAASAVAGTNDVEHWVTDGGKAELLEPIKKAANAVAFVTGLSLVPPYHVEVESPSLQRVRSERAERELAERRAAERLAHLERSAELLKRFAQLRQSGISADAALAQVADSDRSRVLEAALASEANRAGVAPLYAISGTSAAVIRNGNVEVRELPSDVGPFRSVQAIDVAGTPTLALGGRRGVIVGSQRYLAPSLQSELGFNRVAAWNNSIWASHSEAGLLAWDIGNTDAPAMSVPRSRRNNEGPRNLLPIGDHLLFSVGPDVMSIDVNGELRSVSTSTELVIALLSLNGRIVVVVRASGEVEQIETAGWSATRRDIRAGRVSAAAVLPFFDSPRLLVAQDDGPILCISTEDPAVTHYSSSHRGLRTIAATAGAIAALSADRQRVLLFPAGASAPSHDLHITAILKHRVTDLVFLPACVSDCG